MIKDAFGDEMNSEKPQGHHTGGKVAPGKLLRP
jgi:hypothetical protein